MRFHVEYQSGKKYGVASSQSSDVDLKREGTGVTITFNTKKSLSMGNMSSYAGSDSECLLGELHIDMELAKRLASMILGISYNDYQSGRIRHVDEDLKQLFVKTEGVIRGILANNSDETFVLAMLPLRINSMFIRFVNWDSKDKFVRATHGLTSALLFDQENAEKTLAEMKRKGINGFEMVDLKDVTFDYGDSEIDQC